MKKPNKTKRRARPRHVAKKRGKRADRIQRRESERRRLNDIARQIHTDMGPKALEAIEFFREHDTDQKYVARKLMENTEGPWIFDYAEGSLELDKDTRDNLLGLLISSGVVPEPLLPES